MVISSSDPTVVIGPGPPVLLTGLLVGPPVGLGVGAAVGLGLRAPVTGGTVVGVFVGVGGLGVEGGLGPSVSSSMQEQPYLEPDPSPGGPVGRGDGFVGKGGPVGLGEGVVGGRVGRGVVAAGFADLHDLTLMLMVNSPASISFAFPEQDFWQLPVLLLQPP